MTTAVALCEAARNIFSLKVQFPRCSKAIHCLVFGGTLKRVRGSQPKRSATKGKTFMYLQVHSDRQKSNSKAENKQLSQNPVGLSKKA